MLQKRLFAVCVNADLPQVIIGHQIGGRGLHMGADQLIRRQVHQVMPEGSERDRIPNLRDFFIVRA